MTSTISYSVDSVKEQNHLIDETQSKFDLINIGVADLMNIINEFEHIIAQIMESTNVISHHITNLSATSEEVAASSNESVDQTLEATKNMMKLEEILEQIAQEKKWSISQLSEEIIKQWLAEKRPDLLPKE